MFKLLPSELLLKSGEKLETFKTESLSCDVLGFYFSAHWCPPCRRFTPKLAQFYKDFKKTEKGKKFEIVFVSSDRKEEEFKSYFNEMPWLAVPFSSSQRQGLGSKWKVNGIPCLILVDSDGNVITKKGVEEVSSDSEGTGFPWIPKPFWEAFEGKVVDKKGTESKMSDLKESEVIGFYFSDPSLEKELAPAIEAYEKLRAKGAKIEIVFAVDGEEESSWKSFLGKMPWKAFGFNDKRNAVAVNMFDVGQIPSLVLVDSAGNLISADGHLLLTEESEDFPWKQKRSSLQALKGSTLDILNSGPCLLLFPSKEKEDAAEQVSTLQSVVGEFAEKWKDGKLEEDPLSFVYANNHRVDSKVTDFLGISDARPAVRIINIPKGAKYQFSGTKVTADTLRSFATSFLEDKLTSLSLREKET